MVSTCNAMLCRTIINASGKIKEDNRVREEEHEAMRCVCVCILILKKVYMHITSKYTHASNRMEAKT